MSPLYVIPLSFVPIDLSSVLLSELTPDYTLSDRKVTLKTEYWAVQFIQSAMILFMILARLITHIFDRLFLKKRMFMDTFNHHTEY